MLSVNQNFIKMKTKKINYLWWIAIFTIAMIMLCVLTKDTINNLRFNGAHCYLKEFWISDILSTIRAAFREEIVWRFVPLLVFSSIILLLRTVKTKKSIVVLLHVIACVSLIIVQLQFAYAHTDPDSNIDYWDLAMIHGTAGIFFCAAYAFAVHRTIKAMTLKLGGIKKFKHYISVVCISNVIGLVSAIATHLISNVIIIFMHTYYPHYY